MNQEELVQKIAAFIEGPVLSRPQVGKVTPQQMEETQHPTKRPDHGQGDVKDPKKDRRLRENKQKEHAEIAERVRETEESAGEDEDVERAEQHEEAEKVQDPYERERVDHRANLWFDPTKGPNEQPPAAAKPEPMSPEEQALRNHSVHGPYINKLLGPKPNPAAIPQVYEKLKNMQMVASGQEREELQKLVSLVASLVIKSL